MSAPDHKGHHSSDDSFGYFEALEGQSKETIASLQHRFRSHMVDSTGTAQELKRRLESGEPFSFVRLGETEIWFVLRHFEGARAVEMSNSVLFWGGLQDGRLPSLYEFREQVVLGADLLALQDSGLWGPPTLEAFKWWGAAYFSMSHLGIVGRRTFHSLNAIYPAIATDLFESFRGKRLGIVGGKAQIFYEHFYRNAHYRKTFPFLHLAETEITSVINVPDYHGGLFDRRFEIESIVRDHYEDTDVFLLACGTLSKYLAVQIAREGGGVALDIGSGLNAMMNMVEGRPGMAVFQNYEHPTKRFIFSGIELTGIEDK